ncbi:hypothetical protein G5B40_05850 [Pikeienuella piscinae]|uniref:Uncharacterized protein n=1 Tax=Pikeienuella piscinae TaxID=2748098 RepID=A0A7L5BW06_9RHOB|nr:hypothetical protein G5B40_05850 [Pikeienuella piscinae]
MCRWTEDALVARAALCYFGSGRARGGAAKGLPIDRRKRGFSSKPVRGRRSDRRAPATGGSWWSATRRGPVAEGPGVQARVRKSSKEFET